MIDTHQFLDKIVTQVRNQSIPECPRGRIGCEYCDNLSSAASSRKRLGQVWRCCEILANDHGRIFGGRSHDLRCGAFAAGRWEACACIWRCEASGRHDPDDPVSHIALLKRSELFAAVQFESRRASREPDGFRRRANAERDVAGNGFGCRCSKRGDDGRLAQHATGGHPANSQGRFSESDC